MSLPSLFVSHGAPTLAIEPCPARAYLQTLGPKLGRPDAIVMISAHHLSRGVAVTCDPMPETIHDFDGFPSELYSITYPASGQPNLASDIVSMLSAEGFDARLQGDRGLDHGAWVPLMVAFPRADIPIVQVSIDMTKSPQWHFRLGESLAPLRERNVLIIGSGSATHNLREFFHGSFAIDAQPPDWVTEFADWTADHLARGDFDAVLSAVEKGPHGVRNHPTIDHILPLFVAMGAGSGEDALTLHRSTTYAVLAMDVYGFGGGSRFSNLLQAESTG